MESYFQSVYASLNDKSVGYSQTVNVLCVSAPELSEK